MQVNARNRQKPTGRLPDGQKTDESRRHYDKAAPLGRVEKGKTVIQAGERGKSVRQLQHLLNDAFEGTLKVDGTFGRAMTRQLARFQREEKLPDTGRVNQKTLEALQRAGRPDGSGQPPWAAGHRNGYIPSDRMESLAGPGDFKMWPEAAEAYRAMYRAAKEDGLNLNLTGSYRSYQAQVDAHRRKPTLTVAPGTSVHGWGLAVDVSTADKWEQKYAWLRKHADEYGFKGIVSGSNPWAAEAWHWEYRPTEKWNPPG